MVEINEVRAYWDQFWSFKTILEDLKLSILVIADNFLMDNL